MTEELRINKENFAGNQEDYDSIREAVEKLSTASQEQFETLKKEKWYNRVFDMVTFSQKKNVRLAEQIGTVAEAQQIFIELLLRLSDNDANISKLVAESMNDIRRIQEQNLFLMSRIKQLENITLGIKPDTDIKGLSEKARKVLSGCLYKICENNGEPSEEQKKYANAVLQYLNTDIQMDNPTIALSDMDNESKRKILISCMEYMFLKNCTSEDYNKNEDFIEEFDFGKKTIEGIKEQIWRLYKMRGCEGFYSKYVSDNYEEICEMFDLEFDDDIIEENIIEENMNNCYGTVINKELEILHISPIMSVQKGCTKIYEDNEIFISSYIKCEGRIEFRNCKVHYNSKNDVNEILLEDGAELVASNSAFFNDGKQVKPFIVGKQNNVIHFTNCDLNNCLFFLEVDKILKLIIDNCKIVNCYYGFLNIKSSSDASVCDISHNYIAFVREPRNLDLNGEKIGFLKTSSMSCSFTYNVVVQSDEPSININLFEVSDMQMLFCSFYSVQNAIEISGGKIDSCVFYNCKNVISISWKVVVKNCLFERCTRTLKIKGDVEIEKCRFLRCYGNLICEYTSRWYTNVSYCEFLLIEDKGETIAKEFWTKKINENIVIYFDGDEHNFINDEREKSSISKCIFDGIYLKESVLIGTEGKISRGYGYKKPKEPIAYVTDCDFKKCYTDRESNTVIKEYTTYDTFTKNDLQYKAIIISDCRGLDKIKKKGRIGDDEKKLDELENEIRKQNLSELRNEYKLGEYEIGADIKEKEIKRIFDELKQYYDTML